MSGEISITEEEITQTFEQLKKEAESYGYNLNPDIEMTRDLVRGILINEKRYGYRNCPCRLSDGNRDEDLDIICPCDYRDGDVVKYGACYCGLYVSSAIIEGKETLKSIPESRPTKEERKKSGPVLKSQPSLNNLPLPVWRCKVCGYLCARDGPPEVCPICKAKKERFERFL
jgi:ferredoxin-thioredoxin reductase catalytic chain